MLSRFTCYGSLSLDYSQYCSQCHSYHLHAASANPLSVTKLRAAHAGQLPSSVCLAPLKPPAQPHAKAPLHRPRADPSCSEHPRNCHLRLLCIAIKHNRLFTCQTAPASHPAPPAQPHARASMQLPQTVARPKPFPASATPAPLHSHQACTCCSLAGQRLPCAVHRLRRGVPDFTRGIPKLLHDRGHVTQDRHLRHLCILLRQLVVRSTVTLTGAQSQPAHQRAAHCRKNCRTRTTALCLCGHCYICLAGKSLDCDCRFQHLCILFRQTVEHAADCLSGARSSPTVTKHHADTGITRTTFAVAPLPHFLTYHTSFKYGKGETVLSYKLTQDLHRKLQMIFGHGQTSLTRLPTATYFAHPYINILAQAKSRKTGT